MTARASESEVVARERIMAKPDGRPENVDEFMADLTVDERRVLERLRGTIKKACPEAEEVISYGMPAYKYHGMLLWFTAHDKYCGLYVRPGNVKWIQNDLRPYRPSKSTIRFTVEKPLPDGLVRKIVKESMRMNLLREEEKPKRKKEKPKKI
jgi:uncharacterized protein YdhG (YjbR/CyaY superfamily)